MTGLLKICLVGVALGLAACGGGGGGSDPSPGSTTPPSDPTPTPDPLPDPTPIPSPDVFDTIEYQTNWGLDAVNPIAAYEDGISGLGQVIGILDTGIDVNQSELASNIHAASKDVYDGTTYTLTTRSGILSTFTATTRSGGAQLDDEDGHGTFVAGLIAAKRNGANAHGLAFNSKVLAMRLDEPGTCASDSDCDFLDSAIAAGLNYAVANGADVINISLGGSPANSNLEGALESAVAAGTIIVISAGNAPEDTAPFTPSSDADVLALVARQAWANGQIIIAGSFNDTGAISAFSNRAGIGKDFYILAPGEDVFSTGVAESGASGFGTGSGTSFAAPAVAAAAALLLEKFPSLSAAEVVDILLTSATDIGAAGVDVINGHGRLNVAAAMAPIGTTSLTIQTDQGVVLVNPDDGGLVVGGMFGDGFGFGAGGGAIFTDAYDRAYTTGLDTRIQTANPFADFLSRFEAAQDFETAQVDLGQGSRLAFSAHYREPRSPYEEQIAAHLRGGETSADRDVEGVRVRVDTNISPRTAMSFGFGGALEDVMGAAEGSSGSSGAGGAFLAQGTRLPWISDTSAGDAGVVSGGRRYGASTLLPGGMRISGAVGQDEIAVPGLALLADAGVLEATRSTTAARIGRASQRGTWALTLGRVEENGTVLGSFSTGYLGLGQGARSDFAALSGQSGVGSLGSSTVSLFGHLAGAVMTIAEQDGSAFSDYERLQASQFAVGLALDNPALGGSRVSVTVSQPLRLERGSAIYGFASAYDYARETAVYDNAARSLAPSGRELDVELAWQFGLGDGARVSANLLYQRQPGHIATRDDAISVMVTGRSSF